MWAFTWMNQACLSTCPCSWRADFGFLYSRTVTVYKGFCAAFETQTISKSHFLCLVQHLTGWCSRAQMPKWWCVPWSCVSWADGVCLWWCHPSGHPPHPHLHHYPLGSPGSWMSPERHLDSLAQNHTVTHEFCGIFNHQRVTVRASVWSMCEPLAVLAALCPVYQVLQILVFYWSILLRARQSEQRANSLSTNVQNCVRVPYFLQVPENTQTQ